MLYLSVALINADSLSPQTRLNEGRGKLTGESLSQGIYSHALLERKFPPAVLQQLFQENSDSDVTGINSET